MNMGGSTSGDNPRNNNGAGGMDDIDGGGRGFDGRSGGIGGGGGGYHVSPAVAISRRCGIKRSYDHTSEHLFLNNNECHNSHVSPSNPERTKYISSSILYTHCYWK